MADSSLSRRAFTAAIGIPLLLALAYAGGWPWLAAVALLQGLATAEARRMGAHLGWELPALPDYILAVFFQLAVYFCGLPGYAGAVLVALAVRVGVFLLAYPRYPLVSVAVGWLIGTYLGLFSFLVMIERSLGWSFLWSLLFITWANDTGAYLVGRKYGRHRLAPVLSPGKSWEGTISGWMAAVAAGLILAHWFSGPAVEWAAFAWVLAVAGQIGDLWESALKRQAEMKDAGALLPGHGGVLDRFDSLMFAAPVAFFLVPALGL
ncbi:MAG: phosphatidate cytidylyltransferase [Clostridia bacterium]|nr:phosphatidate cytidylyltransferase [Clostridia bacterium]MDH7572390.1 phosphatidate cytidylyltransferase [Clostridia bacterium]